MQYRVSGVAVMLFSLSANPKDSAQITRPLSTKASEIDDEPVSVIAWRAAALPCAMVRKYGKSLEEVLELEHPASKSEAVRQMKATKAVEKRLILSVK
jgi:hypothetical protein